MEDNSNSMDLLNLQEFDEEALKKESEELLEMRFLNGENAVFSRTAGGFLALKTTGMGEKLSDLEQFYPDECAESVYQIDFSEWYKKGYRGVMFDIDNTLVPHGADATAEAVAFFKKFFHFSCTQSFVFPFILNTSSKMKDVRTTAGGPAG